MVPGSKFHPKIVEKTALGRLGASWRVLGASGERLCIISGRPGIVLGRLGCVLGRLGCVLERLGDSWERPGTVLETLLAPKSAPGEIRRPPARPKSRVISLPLEPPPSILASGPPQNVQRLKALPVIRRPPAGQKPGLTKEREAPLCV